MSRGSSGSEFQNISISNRERPTTVGAEPVAQHDELMTAGRAQTLTKRDAGNWRVCRVPRGLVLLASVKKHTELVVESLSIEPMKVAVQKSRQTTATTDDTCDDVLRR